MRKQEKVAAVAAVWTKADLKELKKLSVEDLEWLQAVAELLETTKQTMAEILARYRVGYETSVTASGRKSKRCGDELSKVLTGLDHFQTALLAELVLELEPNELREKYGHLNNGQIRMNSGNRIRGAIKRDELTVEQVKAAATKHKAAIAAVAAA